MTRGGLNAEKQVQQIIKFVEVIEMYEGKIKKLEEEIKLIHDAYKDYVLGRKNLAEFLQIVNMEVQKRKTKEADGQ